MSATVHWRPLSDEGKSFDSGTSTSFTRLTDHLGSKLTEKELKELRAMAAATGEHFYNEVADVIENVGPIEIWATY